MIALILCVIIVILILFIVAMNTVGNDVDNMSGNDVDNMAGNNVDNMAGNNVDNMAAIHSLPNTNPSDGKVISVPPIKTTSIAPPLEKIQAVLVWQVSILNQVDDPFERNDIYEITSRYIQRLITAETITFDDEEKRVEYEDVIGELRDIVIGYFKGYSEDKVISLRQRRN